MRALITAVPGGNIEFWSDAQNSGASAVFEVMVDYQTTGDTGLQRAKLVIDNMDFADSLWDSAGGLHGRMVEVQPVHEDDMNGSIYFHATHTPVHVKKIRVEESDSPNSIHVELHYRLLFDQSGLGDDMDAVLKTDLKVVE